MAGVEFIDPDAPEGRRIFLNDATDPSDFMAFSFLGDNYQVTPTLGGEVETGYASGRSRLWSNAEDNTDWPLGFAQVTADQIAWLIGHRGREVCARDHLGRKVFGAYHAAPVTVSTDSRTYAVDTAQVSLSSVTWSESA